MLPRLARTIQIGRRPYGHHAGRTVQGGGPLRRGGDEQEVKCEGIAHILDLAFEAFAGNPIPQLIAMALGIVAQPAVPLAPAHSFLIGPVLIEVVLIVVVGV